VNLRIGVIGAGNIGTYHIQRLSTKVANATVSAVFDIDTERAAAIAGRIGATAFDRAHGLIRSEEVDAVVVASPGDLHAEQVLACIDVGKPVLCEKPLAPSTADCLKVLEAESEAGRRLVQIGFMRRFDPGYLEAKAALDGGQIGDGLLLHAVHRNPEVPDTFKEFMAITDSVVHEIDLTRWLFGEEITAVTIRHGRASRHAPAQDPQMVFFETESGVIVDVESFVNCRFGYDVRCELVGSDGTVTVDHAGGVRHVRVGDVPNPVPADWKVRFEDAFQAELQGWVNAALAGDHCGASGWDGYAATAVAEAALEALASGERVEVQLAPKPAFYEGG
jgi:myo-inositol 2-dehydrogenase/D-chiro-inositol 1-dehydrogenase